MLQSLKEIWVSLLASNFQRIILESFGALISQQQSTLPKSCIAMQLPPRGSSPGSSEEFQAALGLSVQERVAARFFHVLSW